jgi:hypothetical protein
MTPEQKANKKGISLADAKKANIWAVIPISDLPDNCPVLGVTKYHHKSLAEFNLVENVLVPVIDNHTSIIEEKEKQIAAMVYQQGKTNESFRAEIASLKAEIEKERWIPVSERLPTEDDADKDGYMFPCVEVWNGHKTDTWAYNKITRRKENTHWRKIVKPINPPQ